MFTLHPQLVQDCIVIENLPLSQLLLLNDSLYPWFILVPRIEKITEIYQLSGADQQQLQAESCALAKVLADFYRADKMNVASLGNVVAQLHVHHIVRFHDDACWPKPVWGMEPATVYSEQALQSRMLEMEKIKRHLNLLLA